MHRFAVASLPPGILQRLVSQLSSHLLSSMPRRCRGGEASAGRGAPAATARPAAPHGGCGSAPAAAAASGASRGSTQEACLSRAGCGAAPRYCSHRSRTIQGSGSAAASRHACSKHPPPTLRPHSTLSRRFPSSQPLAQPGGTRAAFDFGGRSPAQQASWDTGSWRDVAAGSETGDELPQAAAAPFSMADGEWPDLGGAAADAPTEAAAAMAGRSPPLHPDSSAGSGGSGGSGAPNRVAAPGSAAATAAAASAAPAAAAARQLEVVEDWEDLEEAVWSPPPRMQGLHPGASGDTPAPVPTRMPVPAPAPMSPAAPAARPSSACSRTLALQDALRERLQAGTAVRRLETAMRGATAAAAAAQLSGGETPQRLLSHSAASPLLHTPSLGSESGAAVQVGDHQPWPERPGLPQLRRPTTAVGARPDAGPPSRLFHALAGTTLRGSQAGGSPAAGAAQPYSSFAGPPQASAYGQGWTAAEEADEIPPAAAQPSVPPAVQPTFQHSWPAAQSVGHGATSQAMPPHHYVQQQQQQPAYARPQQAAATAQPRPQPRPAFAVPLPQQQFVQHSQPPLGSQAVALPLHYANPAGSAGPAPAVQFPAFPAAQQAAPQLVQPAAQQLVQAVAYPAAAAVGRPGALLHFAVYPDGSIVQLPAGSAAAVQAPAPVAVPVSAAPASAAHAAQPCQLPAQLVQPPILRVPMQAHVQAARAQAAPPLQALVQQLVQAAAAVPARPAGSGGGEVDPSFFFPPVRR